MFTYKVERISGNSTPEDDVITEWADATRIDREFEYKLNNPPVGYVVDSWQYLPSRPQAVRGYIVVYKSI